MASKCSNHLSHLHDKGSSQPHQNFRRENADLIYTAKISLGQALTGTTLHIEHLDGRKLDIPINEIVKNDIISTYNFTLRDNTKVEVPCYKINGHIVWGATAMMLAELREILLTL